MDYLPPHNLDAETSVLGGLLCDARLVDDVIDFLKPTDFYRDKHQTIASAIFDMRAQGKTIDTLTVSEYLATKKGNTIEFLDLAELASAVPHTVMTVEHAHIVSEHAIARDLIVAATGIIQDAQSKQYTSGELTSAAEQRIFAVSDARNRVVATLASIEVPQAEQRTRDRLYRGEGRDGIPFGLFDLDEIVSLVPTEVVIVGARPSMGKTVFGLNVAEAVISQSKQPVLFVSLEMSRRALADRLLAARSRVDAWKIQNGDGLRDQDLKALSVAAQSFSHIAPLIIDDAPTRTVSQIAAQARRTKLKYDSLGLIVIDYAQLILPDEKRSGQQRHVELAEISRRVKAMAREVDAPVVLLSQLNRESAKREDKRPQMADLRESGAFEQDADVIILLHRPEYYDPNDSPGMAELIVAKNRNGATGTVKTVFQRNISRFGSLSPQIVTA